MYASLESAQRKARYWARVFARFVEILDGLEKRRDSSLTAAIVFFMQRALGGLEMDEPASHPYAPVEPLDGGGPGTYEGTVYAHAIDFALVHANQDQELAADELQVLMVLAGGLLQSEGDGRFGDSCFTSDEIAREYGRLGGAVSADALRGVELFPSEMVSSWVRILEHAERTGDPLRRLRLEMTAMRVVRSLYAMAVGLRSEVGQQFAAGPEDADPAERTRFAWIAFTSGDSLLSAARG